jgi:thioredoxin reductase (NADPH)
MDTLLTFGVFIILIALVAVPYWRKAGRDRRKAEELREKSSKIGIVDPVTLHPKIDISACIGCGSCVDVCPENVLGLVEGRAAIVNGVRCIGHALCAEVCPVGAITMGFGTPREGMELPYYDDHLMTNVAGLYIIGELGGIGLIRNAVDQGIRAVGHIAASQRVRPKNGYDVVIVGAGPAGIGASLAAKEHQLRHLILEQQDLGGSILHYPRQKLVLTSPVELPLHGRLKISEISKEELLTIFESLVKDYSLPLKTHEKVEAVTKDGETFSVTTPKGTVETSSVILALGRRGSPRKLGVSGEDLPKVAYRLIEAETYRKKSILVVGGGDSAVEAAVALARQSGNSVSISYRRESFVRLKEKNEKNIAAMMREKTVNAVFESEVSEIRAGEVSITRKNGTTAIIPNDYVFIFAGGEMPYDFLKNAGVRMRGPA